MVLMGSTPKHQRNERPMPFIEPPGAWRYKRTGIRPVPAHELAVVRVQGRLQGLGLDQP